MLASLLAVLALPNADHVHGQNSNSPPVVSIVRPASYCLYAQTFRRMSCLKIKALANDPDGTIAQVQFFSDVALIGVVTNAPFEMVWDNPPVGGHYVKAVAFDDLGASSESDPVTVVFPEFVGSRLVFEIRSPANGGIYPSPAAFEFSAELLATVFCNTGPVEFFVGTNSVGTVTQSGPFTVSTPLYSLTVTNMIEGDYQLSLRKESYSADSYAPGSCDGVFIHVTKLGIRPPRLTPDSRIEFDVVTSFPTNENVIEVSWNLLNWSPISTNVPSSNTFTFTEPSPATDSPRFYRAVVPSQ